MKFKLMDEVIRYSNEFISYLEQHGLSYVLASTINVVIFIILLTIIAIASDFLTNRILYGFLSSIAKRTKNQWDDLLMDRKLFKRISHVVPAIILFYLVPSLIPKLPGLGEFVRDVAGIYIVIVVLRSLDIILNIVYKIFQHYELSGAKPIKGYIQILQVVAYFVAVIVVIAMLINRNPVNLFLGLGAFAAVLVIIFKDTIMGFIGSIQLSANDMVRQGDWITMAKYGADGTVTDITLTTVKVRNFDKTITTIPTYSLVSDAFQNWRGMEESGARRIKRFINIDMTSVQFCSDDMLERYKKVQLINDYIVKKQSEIDEHNAKRGFDTTVLVNGRRQTNLGIFRAYMVEYMRNHPDILADSTLMIRHLQPTETGIPLEIYAFTKKQEWEIYESIMADIFDHMLAVVPQFDLRVFQSPTGQDLSSAFKG